MTINKEQTI
jgi:hypothetical protein